MQPAVDRLPLSDGDFIDVKRELNAGEQRHVFSTMVRDGVTAGEKIVLNPAQVGLTKVIEYLVGWSFLDAHGTPVPVTDAAIQSLDFDTFQEITDAIDAHEKAHDEQRAAERKNRAGATELKAISESVAP